MNPSKPARITAQNRPNVMVCQPRYNSSVHDRSLTALLTRCTLGGCNPYWGTQQEGSPVSASSSLLEHTFNHLWCAALNARKTFKIDYFAMLHADIEPMPGWCDVAISELRRVGADVISAVVPFKNGTGWTSTGLGEKHWPRNAVSANERARKLTMTEVYNLPETFSAAEVDPDKVLLVNSGCWLCDFTQPWVEKICFAIHSKNYLGSDGNWHSATRGEDWDASYQFFDLGLRVFATRKIQVVHYGEFGYANFPEPWGAEQTDQAYIAWHKSGIEPVRED